MAKIINLRQARKARNRTEALVQADQNRAKFGRTRAEKDRDRIEAERQVRLIDGAKLEGNE